MLRLFQKKKTDLTKFEEYKEYMSYYENKNTEWISFNAQGWSRLIHERLDERIAKDFDLHPIKDRCWASDYIDGRRKVITLELLNNNFATLKWGWNFEDIPRITKDKCEWARTDKSIYAHTFRVSEEYINGTGNGSHRKSVFGRSNFRKPEDFNKIIEEIDTAYEFVKGDIKIYFEQTYTEAGLLSELEDICNSRYYNFAHPENHLIKVYLEYRMDEKDKAMKDLEKVSFSSEKLKKEYLKKAGMSSHVL